MKLYSFMNGPCIKFIPSIYCMEKGFYTPVTTGKSSVSTQGTIRVHVFKGRKMPRNCRKDSGKIPTNAKLAFSNDPFTEDK